MSDTRLRVKELIKLLWKCHEESVIIIRLDGGYFPFYNCYQFENKNNRFEFVIEDLNSLLGEKLDDKTTFVLLK